MKKLGKFFANFLIITYALIAIIVTILLLSYNEYHCSVLGGYTFILVTDDELEPDYAKGSLILVKETKAKNIDKGDNIFFYRTISPAQFEVKPARVLMKDTTRGEEKTQYVLEGNTIIDHNDVIGSDKDIKIIPHLGTILSVLESRYGYLFLIVVVSFVAFLYEIYELIIEVKYGEREDDEEDDDDYEDYEEEEKPRNKVTPQKKVATDKKTSTTKKVATAGKTTTTAKKTVTARKTTTSNKSEKKSTTTRKKQAQTK